MKSKSAYFVFADSHRVRVREDILNSASSADGAPNVKVSVASIAKEIGVRWKALSEVSSLHSTLNLGL